MTDLEINKSIASILGWKDIHEVKGILYGIIPDADEYDSQGALEKYFEIPDFSNDLNAMHIAEKYVMCEYSIVYKEWLDKLSCSWHASAKVRAEAFLRTFDKFKQ